MPERQDEAGTWMPILPCRGSCVSLAQLTACPLADDFDPSLLVALGFLQLALVAVGGIVRATHRGHHHWAGSLLADTGGLGGVGGAPLAYGSESAQHSSAHCRGERQKEARSA